ncbi:MAG: NAD(P)/FAD-dependent oxidoreductase [Bacillota bacterium]
MFSSISGRIKKGGIVIHIVIIGNSAAAINAVEIIRKYNKQAKITMVSDEKENAYSPILTTYYIGDKVDKNGMNFKDESFYINNKINRKFGNKAVDIDPDDKKVYLNNEETINYDKLLIATGANPYLPDIEGINKNGVFTVRKKKDALKIRDKAKKSKKAVILGGGLVSLKTASALTKQGIEITLIIGSNKVLSQLLDNDSSKIVAEHLEKNDYNILKGSRVKKIIGDNEVKEVLLKSNKRLSADMVIIGKGVVPNKELVKNTNIKTDDGILVDDYMQTNLENIYAAGDVAQSYDIVNNEKTVSGTWPVAVEQGKIAAYNILGNKKKYKGSLTMNVIDLYGLEIGTTGITQPPDNDKYQVITIDKKDYFKKFIIKENKIVGAIFIGDLKEGGLIRSIIRNKININKLEPLNEFLTDLNNSKFYKKIKKINN